MSDIRAGFLWIEVISIYCPSCQKDAPKFNQLYELVQKDRFLSANMKMLAIGTGNNAREVAHFRKYFNVPFPILADPDFKAHEALKKARTPLILLVDKRSRPYKVIAVLDPRKGAEVLLQDIRSGVSLAAP